MTVSPSLARIGVMKPAIAVVVIVPFILTACGNPLGQGGTQEFIAPSGKVVTVQDPVLASKDDLHPDEAAKVSDDEKVIDITVTEPDGVTASTKMPPCRGAGAWIPEDKVTTHDMFVCPEEIDQVTVEVSVHEIIDGRGSGDTFSFVADV